MFGKHRLGGALHPRYFASTKLESPTHQAVGVALAKWQRLEKKLGGGTRSPCKNHPHNNTPIPLLASCLTSQPVNDFPRGPCGGFFNLTSEVVRAKGDNSQETILGRWQLPKEGGGGMIPQRVQRSRVKNSNFQTIFGGHPVSHPLQKWPEILNFFLSAAFFASF